MTRAPRACHATPLAPRAALRRIVERATVSGCMRQLAVTERARERTAARSRERMSFERPIGSFQALYQRAADADVPFEAIRLARREADRRRSEVLPAAGEVTAS